MCKFYTISMRLLRCTSVFDTLVSPCTFANLPTCFHALALTQHITHPQNAPSDTKSLMHARSLSAQLLTNGSTLARVLYALAQSVHDAQGVFIGTASASRPSFHAAVLNRDVVVDSRWVFVIVRKRTDIASRNFQCRVVVSRRVFLTIPSNARIEWCGAREFSVCILVIYGAQHSL